MDHSSKGKAKTKWPKCMEIHSIGMHPLHTAIEACL